MIPSEHLRLGGTFIASGNGEVTGEFAGVLAVTAGQLANIVFLDKPYATFAGEAVLEAATIAAGVYIPVPFTTIEVTSGTFYILGSVAA